MLYSNSGIPGDGSTGQRPEGKFAASASFWAFNALALFFLWASALVTQMSAQENGGVQFWFGGEDPVTVQDKHRNGPDDFLALFQDNAPWAQCAAKTTVFKISMQFATRSSDADFKTVIDGLRSRHIPLAIEMGMLRNDRGCGKGEGYMSKELLTQAMKRIRQAGGQLAYVAMDEVVFFGHEKSWPDQPGQVSCQDSLPEIVQEVAANVTLIHQFFPAAKIGAVEPMTTNNQIDINRIVRDYATFADLYRQATGSNLAFMHADIAWRSKNWQAGVAPLKAAMQSRGIRYGTIIGGNPNYTDDASWTAAGLGQLKALASDPATAPQDVIIQSWQPLPKHYLPETTPGTSTWMLLQAEKIVH